MTPASPSCSKAERRLAAVSILALALALPACQESQENSLDAVASAKVTRGPLRVMVTEGGDLESSNPVTIRSEVEGRTTIVELVQEGSRVSTGDVLVRLDTLETEEKLQRKELDVESARSSVTQAQEAIEIQDKQNTESLKAAQTNYDLAKQALEAYEKGKLLLERAELVSDLLIAEEKQKRAEEEAAASRRLFEKKFLSKTDLEADELAATQAKEAVKIARGRLKQLEEYTKESELQRLRSDMDVKKLALERMEQQCRSEMKQKEDILANRQRSLTMESEYRDKLARMMEKSVIRSPADGMVVYSTKGGRRYGRGEPIEVGKEVREREEILKIPDLANLEVKVDIHESSIKRLQPGQRALITVDAIPGRTFTGTVERVAPVASSESSWMNPDLKVYQTIVHLDESAPEMKPGMHAQVQIMVGGADDALQVPLQAVHERGSQAYVWVRNGDEVDLREVTCGLNNEVAVQILKGLEVGEEVFLSRPPGAPALPEPKSETPDLGPAAAALASTTSGQTESPNAEKTRESRRRGSNMTPEQREAMRERMKNMSPEERKALRDRMRGTRPQEDD